MEYVMVPVPEEIVGLVKDYINWGLSGPETVTNPDAVREVYDEADTGLQQLIRMTAEATHIGDLTSITDVVEATGMSPREVFGAVSDLHARIISAGRSTALIMPRLDPRDLPEGRHESHHRLLHMSKPDAAMIAEFSLGSSADSLQESPGVEGE